MRENSRPEAKRVRRSEKGGTANATPAAFPLTLEALSSLQKTAGNAGVCRLLAAGHAKNDSGCVGEVMVGRRLSRAPARGVGIDAERTAAQAAAERRLPGTQPTREVHLLESFDPDVNEFDVIRRIGIATPAGKRIGSVEEYLKLRRATFGSTGDSDEVADRKYWVFAGVSDAELDADAGRLRRLIEHREKGEQVQSIFYRWVRRAFMDDGVTDVPAGIKQGIEQSGELKKIVNQEWKALKRPSALATQGSNPRPMKNAAYQYQLGTLSEHAKGGAIDIEPQANPILRVDDWAWIEQIAGTKTKRNPATWKKLWETDPRALWKTIKDTSDAFAWQVTQGAWDYERQPAQRAAKHSLLAPPAPPLPGEQRSGVSLLAGGPDPQAEPSAKALEHVVGTRDRLKKWRKGFFTLDEELVVRLQARGLVWGATFTDRIDLHHFELAPPKSGTSDWPERAAERHRLVDKELVGPE